jgi:alcohol dehydrogenase (NADP+)
MPDCIDPRQLPRRKLAGDLIHCIGMGTFGSDLYGPEEISGAVAGALRFGYRLFDCASVYGNEEQIGRVFDEAISGGSVYRENIFVISKVWNDMHGRGDVLLSLAKTLRDLRLDYIDAYLIHWPFPNYHAPGCDGDARNPNSVPFSPDSYISVWRQMEKIHDMGLARHIGMSNMTISKMEAVLPRCRIKPALLEMELHPSFQQPELFRYCINQNIQPIAYSPLGSPKRPGRDRSPDDVVDTELPEIIAIARNRGIHPALVCLKWAVQRGQIPIPFSVHENNYRANLLAVCEDPLTEAEMKTIEGADKNCRLIKGQVFLWEDAGGWEDLWDNNITNSKEKRSC